MPRPIKLGLHELNCPPSFELVQGLAQRLGAPVQIISWYQAWGSSLSGCRSEFILETHRRGYLPLITWEPWQLPDELPAGVHPFDQPEFSVDKITSGLYHKYVRSWARTLADAKKLVYLRPMHEMNGNWYPWGGTTNGNSAAAFRQAWRYLREVFRQEGANNVTWVWCPYARSVPDIPENALESYFPGEDEVDWLGLDGYNWGTTQPWSSWERFTDVFGPAYERLARLAPRSPVMIAETGSAEDGGDKASWITEALESLASDLVRVQILVWFNLNKECDWRIDSSPNSLQAFQKQARRFQLP